MQVDMESLREIMFACVGTVIEIEANADTFYATVRTQQSRQILSFPGSRTFSPRTYLTPV